MRKPLILQDQTQTKRSLKRGLGLMCGVCGEETTVEEGEEGRKSTGKKVEPRPSQEEVDEHMRSHVPCRVMFLSLEWIIFTYMRE